MPSWIRRAFIGLASLAVIAGGLAACGHRPHPTSPAAPEQVAQWRGKAVERVSRQLDLSAEQRQKLELLADKLVAQRTAMIGQTPNPRAEVQALVAGAKFDRARAQVLLDEKTRALQQSTPEVITALADFYDSLQPAQQAQVRAFLEKRRGRWHRG